MSTAVSTPKPGVYYDVPFADYLQWDAVSNSRINLARRSLLHFSEAVFKEPTPALRLGSFIHCGVLEPLAIIKRYAVMPAFEKDAANVTKGGEPSASKGTDYYKNACRRFAEANAGKEIIEQQKYDTLLGINRALFKSKRASQYLSERGPVEVSILWVDDETQLTCKCRIDLLNSGINDLKTCADAMDFPRSIARYGYHRQAAHYQNGFAVAGGGELLPFRLIAVETSAPYGVRAAPLNEDAIETGRAEVRETLRAIADAKVSNDWPGYEDPSSWCLPAYYGGDDEIELTVNGETVVI